MRTELSGSNAQRMGLDLTEIECIILSHGHYDHCGGLLAILRAINRDLPIIVHEDMFKTRGVANLDGTIRRHPEFPREDKVRPARYIKTKDPYPVANSAILVTGEIQRKTQFEKGLTQHRVFVDGEWQPDPWIWDDRAVVVNIRKKGLLVLAGCSHAGIVNTMHYAQQITGIDSIFAVIGGFHLAGKDCESRINQTVEELKLLDPKLVVPCHCTGWRAAYSISEAMPQAFVWNSVGNLYRL